MNIFLKRLRISWWYIHVSNDNSFYFIIVFKALNNVFKALNNVINALNNVINALNNAFNAFSWEYCYSNEQLRSAFSFKICSCTLLLPWNLCYLLYLLLNHLDEFTCWWIDVCQSWDRISNKQQVKSKHTIIFHSIITICPYYSSLYCS